MNSEWLSREKRMLGDAAVEKLCGASVLLFGVGGVGGYALEALVRAGIGRIAVVDNDTVSESNLNRQIIADRTTVGQSKVKVAAERAERINPEIKMQQFPVFADDGNVPEIFDSARPDYVIDAIDTVTAKLAIIREAKKRDIPVISSMGTGAKSDPTRFRITDISKTHTCPLAKVMRVRLRNEGILHCDVLFSDEPPVVPDFPPAASDDCADRRTPGSLSFVPSVAGLIIAGHVIKQIAGIS